MAINNTIPASPVNPASVPSQTSSSATGSPVTPVPVSPQTPQTPTGDGRPVSPLLIGGVVLLGIVAIVGVVIVGQSGQKTTSNQPPVSTAQSPAPVSNQYTSQKYGYSFSYPAGWQSIDVLDYRKQSFGALATNSALTEVQKKNLDQYYSLVDVELRDKVVKGRKIFVRAKNAQGTSFNNEVEYYKKFLDETYSEITYLRNEMETFQDQPAYFLETKGRVTANELHGREIIFERNNLIFTIVMLTNESDWSLEQDQLFEQMINSFAI